MGQSKSPPLIYLALAAEFTMWSIDCMAKLKVMNSIMGLQPARAAPTPKPVKPASVIGVSITLSSPNSTDNYLDTL